MRPIVLEGPDGAGKSTLAKVLTKMLDRPIYHTGGPPVSRSDFDRKIEQMELQGPRVILDRIPYISERVYGAMAGRFYMSPSEMDDRLAEYNPVVVYCRRRELSGMFTSIDRTNKPHKPVSHLEQVLKDYKKVVDDYDAFFLDYRGDSIGYDWGLDSVSELVRILKTCAD